MDRIWVELDDSRVRKALNQLLRLGTDLSPAMKVIAGHLEDSAKESFERESSPDGTPWKPLSSVTLEQRKKRGFGAGPILQRSGDLQGSIVSDWGADFAETGTNKVYVTTQHFGADQGAFGRNSRGGPIPWGNGPAHPFLGIWPQHEDAAGGAVPGHSLGLGFGWRLEGARPGASFEVGSRRRGTAWACASRGGDRVRRGEDEFAANDSGSGAGAGGNGHGECRYGCG